MEAASLWHSLAAAPWWWHTGAAGLGVAAAGAMALVAVRRRTAGDAPFDDSTLRDDDDGTGFRTSRFAARVCTACSQPMLLEGDGRWRCAGYPACRG
jgi:hypothetical protein